LDEYYIQWIQNIVKNRKDIPNDQRMLINQNVLNAIAKNLKKWQHSHADF
jgi:hypothetical protein